MKKIPVPVMVGVVVAAVLILGIVVFNGVVRPSGDSGDVKAITKEIIQNNPKGMGTVPDDKKPAAQAMMAGRRGH